MIRKRLVIYIFLGISFFNVSVNATKNIALQQEKHSNKDEILKKEQNNSKILTRNNIINIDNKNDVNSKIEENLKDNLEDDDKFYEKNKEKLKKEYKNSNSEKNYILSKQISPATSSTEKLKKTNNKTEDKYSSKDLEKRKMLYKELNYLQNLLKPENSIICELKINKLINTMKTNMEKIDKNNFNNTYSNIINKTKEENIKTINTANHFLKCNTKREIFNELVRICSALKEINLLEDDYEKTLLKEINLPKDDYEKTLKLVERNLNSAIRRANNNINYIKINTFIKSKQLFDKNFYRELENRMNFVNKAIVKLYQNIECKDKNIESSNVDMFSILKKKIDLYTSTAIKYKNIIENLSSFLNPKNEDIVVVANLYTFDFPDLLRCGNVLSEVLNSFCIKNGIYYFISKINNYLKKLEKIMNAYINNQIDNINKTIFEKCEKNINNRNWIESDEIENIDDVLNNLEILSKKYPNESLYNERISFFNEISELDSQLRKSLKLS